MDDKNNEQVEMDVGEAIGQQRPELLMMIITIKSVVISKNFNKGAMCNIIKWCDLVATTPIFQRCNYH